MEHISNTEHGCCFKSLIFWRVFLFAFLIAWGFYIPYTVFESNSFHIPYLNYSPTTSCLNFMCSLFLNSRSLVSTLSRCVNERIIYWSKSSLPRNVSLRKLALTLPAGINFNSPLAGDRTLQFTLELELVLSIHSQSYLTHACLCVCVGIVCCPNQQLLYSSRHSLLLPLTHFPLFLKLLFLTLRKRNYYICPIYSWTLHRLSFSEHCSAVGRYISHHLLEKEASFWGLINILIYGYKDKNIEGSLIL